MKNPPSFCVAISLLLIPVFSLFAQSRQDSIKQKKIPGVIISYDTLKVNSIEPMEKKKNYLEAGISFQNNAVYLGRKDSSVLPYFIPSITYHLKSGLYFSANVNYLVNSETSQIDLIILEGGYVFNSGNYDGQVTISKFFYNGESSNVASEIEASAGYQNAFDIGFIKPTLSLNLDFGPQIDYNGSFGLEHGFTGLGNKLEYTPTLIVNAGTEHYYDNYYKNKGYSNKKKGQTPQSGSGSVTGSLVNPSHFKIMDYEASLPMSYTMKKLVINFTPTYAIPVNPALINVQTKQSNGTSSNKTVSESLSNTIYFSIGATFRIG